MYPEYKQQNILFPQGDVRSLMPDGEAAKAPRKEITEEDFRKFASEALNDIPALLGKLPSTAKAKLSQHVDKIRMPRADETYSAEGG